MVVPAASAAAVSLLISSVSESESAVLFLCRLYGLHLRRLHFHLRLLLNRLLLQILCTQGKKKKKSETQQQKADR